MKICRVSRAAMAFVLFSASAYAATVTVPIQEGTVTFMPPPGSGGAPVTDCVGKTTTATTNQMAILAPCSRNVITANQGAIEPPDHPLGDLNGVALLVVGGNQLMDETFGMYPAQCVRADAKLTRVVRNNHGIGQ